MTYNLSSLFKDSQYKLTQFSEAQREELSERITEKEVKGASIPYITCLVRKKEIKLTPEEAVRQLYLAKLHHEYGYPYARMELEYAVKTGSSSKRADIVIFEAERKRQPYIIIELKEPRALDGKKQLESYCKFEGASIGVWTNGNEIEYYFKQEHPKSKTTYLEKLSYLPSIHQTLSEILDVRFTLKQLIINDKLQTKSLKEVIVEFEDIVLANSGVDSFEEIFKLLFTKLYDEYCSSEDADKIAFLRAC